jgi:antitoxin YefM
MKAITYSAAKTNLAATIESVCQDCEPVIITKNTGSVVLISLDDYNSMQETAYLMQSPKNASRLLKSLESSKIIRK